MTPSNVPNDPLMKMVEYALEMTDKALCPTETIIGRVDANGTVYDVRRYHRPRVVSATKDIR